MKTILTNFLSKYDDLIQLIDLSDVSFMGLTFSINNRDLLIEGDIEASFMDNIKTILIDIIDIKIRSKFEEILSKIEENIFINLSDISDNKEIFRESSTSVEYTFNFNECVYGSHYILEELFKIKNRLKDVFNGIYNDIKTSDKKITISIYSQNGRVTRLVANAINGIGTSFNNNNIVYNSDIGLLSYTNTQLNGE